MLERLEFKKFNMWISDSFRCLEFKILTKYNCFKCQREDVLSMLEISKYNKFSIDILLKKYAHIFYWMGLHLHHSDVSYHFNFWDSCRCPSTPKDELYIIFKYLFFNKKQQSEHRLTQMSHDQHPHNPLKSLSSLDLFSYLII